MSYPSYGQTAHEPTIVKPTPGGRRPAPVQLVAPPTDYAPEDTVDLTLGGLNPLVAAAGPILTLARRLRTSAAQSNIEELRERVADEIKTFEKRAQGTGVTNEAARAAHYALCATIDDIVLNTPWGASSTWARAGMVITFHIDVTGGERFYDLLNHLLKDPAANFQVLELMYLCLSLGFEGRLRILPQGSLEHSRIRDNLYRILTQRRGEAERELSVHWRGVEAPFRPLLPSIEFWTVMAATLIIITVMATGFSFALNGSSDATLEKMATLPPVGQPSVALAQPTAPVQPKSKDLDQFRAFLAPEIAQGLVTVVPQGTDTVVRIRNAGMFASGSSEVNESYTALLNRIGEALNTRPGAVLITGHTDNIPIRTIRFPSNWHLSQARADAVAAVIATHLTDKSRLKAQGMADTQPIATNDQDAGREANRRIDVILSSPAAAVPAPSAASVTPAAPPAPTPNQGTAQ
ncbi:MULTISPECIES: type IVB secretion system protein IcmH/DotU [Nitrospirillum]|uniref:Type VI secretion system protein ImpK n=1 Tax=Nitrospirillum amazonense TaxID=28077 RepID=A0A560FJD7_9PROT|nr:type IVB secretion system protein IcmH/DotU [Nitrospirillum amazonense]MEC4592361.1 type IVB secretion system protein IcmH/DotU [Nitrospirillum amazonense]TWB21718.1 type VI secretion system protein ImpK [Nitrospirillum amazonense]